MFCVWTTVDAWLVVPMDAAYTQGGPERHDLFNLVSSPKG